MWGGCKLEALQVFELDIVIPAAPIERRIVMLEHFTEEIIRLSDNSSGTVLNNDAINHVVNALIENMKLDKKHVDILIANNETDSGYLMKAGDFIYVLEPYICGIMWGSGLRRKTYKYSHRCVNPLSQ